MRTNKPTREFLEAELSRLRVHLQSFYKSNGMPVTRYQHRRLNRRCDQIHRLIERYERMLLKMRDGALFE